MIFRDRPDVYVAADHLIYVKEGDPKLRPAPDVYVAFGRPKGDRGSYKVWQEGGVFPQVVFEILPPDNRASEMTRKFQFYERYGAEEYYIYDPDANELTGWVRSGAVLDEIASLNGWVSPRLKVRFDTTGPELLVYKPDGQRFLAYQEILDQAALVQAEKRRADAAQRELDRLRAKLRAAGIDPDAP